MVVRRPASKVALREVPGLSLGDDRLLVEAAKRDPGRFAELYEHNFARVYAYIARRVGDRDVAQDLTSDVFHKALAGIQSFEWRGVPFAGWLLRIAANMIVDRSKRSGREVSGSDDLPEPSVQPNLDAIDQQGRLFRLVEQLPADQRRVIGMRFAEEKSIREIATELGRSEGAVKQLQFRALQNLRARMEGANA
jgi:RNA polymerase sigma-70 factor (ECF subfamily)